MRRTLKDGKPGCEGIPHFEILMKGDCTGEYKQGDVMKNLPLKHKVCSLAYKKENDITVITAEIHLSIENYE